MGIETTHDSSVLDDARDMYRDLLKTPQLANSYSVMIEMTLQRLQGNPPVEKINYSILDPEGKKTSVEIRQSMDDAIAQGEVSGRRTFVTQLGERGNAGNLSLTEKALKAVTEISGRG